MAAREPRDGATRPWSVFLGTALVAVAVHAWSLTQPFLGEDLGAITQVHRELEASVWSPLIAFMAPADELGFFRPMIGLVLAIDYVIWGIDPMGFHATNLVLFGAVCGLAAQLAARLGQSSYVGVIAGVMLAVSPLVPEDVTWVLGRDGLIPMLFALAACHAALSLRRRRAMFGVAGFFLAGLFAKEWVCAMLPVLIALRSTALCGNSATPWRSALRDTIFVWPALAVYLTLRVLVLGRLVGGYSAEIPSPLGGQFWIDRVDYLLALLVQVPELTVSGVLRYSAGVLILAWLAWRVGVARHRLGGATRGVVVVCILWILGCMAVHFPVRVDTRALADSRYLFPPLPALCILLAIACRGSAPGLGRCTFLAGCVVAVMGVGLVQSAAEWRLAGDAMKTLTATLRRLASEARPGPIQIHGIPPTIGRARFGLGMQSATDAPFRQTKTPEIQLFVDRYMPHRGKRRAAGYLALLEALRRPSAVPQVYCWDRQELRIRSLGDPDAVHEVRGRVVRDPGVVQGFELDCSKLELEFGAEANPPGPGEDVILRGSITTVDGTTRLRVQQVERATPIVALKPDPDDRTGVVVAIHHRADAVYGVFFSDQGVIHALPGYGVVMAGASQPILAGFLDGVGRAEISISNVANVRGFLQVGVFDTEGRVTLSRCICSKQP